ncbi:MAG: hypothetical protein EPO68_09190 [Planctomycetota bacterium]|nr:MAG: hypothetical protein EPO68_09190 [Planctomycetota bacterium]
MAGGSDLDELRATRRFHLLTALSGAGLIALAAALGIAGQVYAMYEAFETIERSKAPTPGELTRSMETAMRTWAWCGLIAAIGLVLLMLGLVLLFRADREHAAAADAELPTR